MEAQEHGPAKELHSSIGSPKAHVQGPRQGPRLGPRRRRQVCWRTSTRWRRSFAAPGCGCGWATAAGRGPTRPRPGAWPAARMTGPRGLGGWGGKLGDKVGKHHVAVGQNQWYRFGVGAPPILVYFSEDWDVHCRYGILTHGHVTKPTSTSD